MFGYVHEEQADPHYTPPNHDKAINYIMNHPGTSYEAALAATARPNVATYAFEMSVANPHFAPPNHAAAIAYIMQHPGTTYEAALIATQ